MGKHLERIDYAHVVCLMYILKTSTKDSMDLSIGFDGSNQRRKEELTIKKEAPIEGRFHVRFHSKDFLEMLSSKKMVLMV